MGFEIYQCSKKKKKDTVNNPTVKQLKEHLIISLKKKHPVIYWALHQVSET